MSRPDLLHLDKSHVEKLLTSAIPKELHNKLAMSSVGADILRIEYLNPDGSKTTTHEGRPFVRERLSEAERDNMWTKFKRDDPTAKRPGKYRSAKGQGCRIYHSPLCVAQPDYEERLNNVHVELRFTEGELKGIAANIHDPKTVTIAFGGVNSWRDRYDGQAADEPSKPIVELEEIPVAGRRVRLCFDSDLHKPQVRAALRDLATYLNERGAVVIIEVLPSLPKKDSNGEWIRLGIDDLIYECGAEAFLNIKKIAQPAFKERRSEIVYAPELEPSSSHRRNVYLKALIGKQWRACSEQSNAWWQWTGTHFKLVPNSDSILRTIEVVMESNGWDNREQSTVNSLLAAFRRSVALDLPVSTKGLVPCLNGCLRLSDRKLIAHDPDHGNTYCLAFDFNPLTTAGPILETIETMVTPVELVIYQALLQSIVTAKTRKAFIEITGPGNSGKSVLGRLATALAGTANTVACDLEKMEDKNNRFETIKLRGKRLAVFNECDRYSGPLNVVKSITGGDRITAEMKKSTVQVDFYFEGLTLLIGNSPVRPSDSTGAVINRRRSISVPEVITSESERELLEPDGDGWRGEFAEHLSGLLNWALSISEADAKVALGKDSNDIGRIQRDLETVFDTDNLARWAEEYLVYDPDFAYSQVGNSRRTYLNTATPREQWEHLLLPHYEERVEFSVGAVKFKNKLIDLLRDTYSLPLPKGSTQRGDYRVRVIGSVIPHVRLRQPVTDKDKLGIVTQAALFKVNPLGGRVAVPTEEVGHGQTPLGNRGNGCNEYLEVISNKGEKGNNTTRDNTHRESVRKTPQTRSASDCKGSAHVVPVTPLSTRDALPEPLVNHEVATVRDWVSAAYDALSDAGRVIDESTVYEVITSWSSAPEVSKPQVKNAFPEVLSSRSQNYELDFDF